MTLHDPDPRRKSGEYQRWYSGKYINIRNINIRSDFYLLLKFMCFPGWEHFWSCAVQDRKYSTEETNIVISFCVLVPHKIGSGVQNSVVAVLYKIASTAQKK